MSRMSSTSTEDPGATPARRPSAPCCSTPEGEVVDERGERIGVATNNVAEYKAVLLGVELALRARGRASSR